MKMKYRFKDARRTGRTFNVFQTVRMQIIEQSKQRRSAIFTQQPVSVNTVDAKRTEEQISLTQTVCW